MYLQIQSCNIFTGIVYVFTLNFKHDEYDTSQMPIVTDRKLYVDESDWCVVCSWPLSHRVGDWCDCWCVSWYMLHRRLRRRYPCHEQVKHFQ